MSRERRRVLDVIEDETAEPGRFGCPMLTRVRMAGAMEGAIPPMRCSLGWALHDEIEFSRCRATDVVTDCWKIHPERTPVVALPVPPETEAVEAAVSERVAGD